MKWNPYSDGHANKFDQKRREALSEQKRQNAESGKRLEKKASSEPHINPETLEIAKIFSQKNRDSRIQIVDPFFAEIGDRDKHLDYVASKERTYSKIPEKENAKIFADAIEYLIVSCINHANWIGEQWHAQLAGTYDDLRNGIDIVLENVGDAMETRKPMGLSLDVTFSGDPVYLSEKFTKHKQLQLDQGKLAQLLYYKPIDANSATITRFQQRPHFIPHCIVGFNFEWANGLLKAFGKEENANNISRVYGLILMYQIEQQLIAFHEYSIMLGRKMEREQGEEAAKPFVSAAGHYNVAYSKIKAALDQQLTTLGGDPMRGRAWVQSRIEGDEKSKGDAVSKLILKHAESIKKHA